MCMSSNDYTVLNIHRYSRKSYKNNRLDPAESYLVNARNDINTGISDASPKNERFTVGTPGCSCAIDSEGEVTNILHHKCPVIALAQQQLQKLLEKDILLCDNARCCRSVLDFLQICKDAWNQDRCQCRILVIILCVFMIGLLLGAATCGVSYRKFNSPLFTCIDSYFIPDTYTKIEDAYRSIV